MFIYLIQIRSAIFRLICSLASSTHHLNDSFKQFSPLVLGGLAEKDSIVVGPLWDAVLYLLDSDKVKYMYDMYSM